MGAAGSNRNDVSEFNAAKIQPISEVVRLTEHEKAESVSQEFWKAHAVVNLADSSWPCLPGLVPDVGNDPDMNVYNNKIRLRSTSADDGAEVADPPRSRRASAAKVAVDRGCRWAIVARETDGKHAPLSRSSTVRSRESAGSWTTSSNLSAIDENSPSGTPTSSSSLRSTASSTAAWSEVESPSIDCADAESQKVPPSGLWSDVVVAGFKICAISRELVFHQNGDISGVSVDADSTSFINGLLQPGTGSLSWTELLPSGKNKFRGKVQMEDGRVLLRGSVMKSGRSIGHFELSSVTQRQRGQRP